MSRALKLAFFTIGGESRRKGLGKVQGGDLGFLAHSNLRVSADGQRTPLGLLAVDTQVRGQSPQQGSERQE